MANRRRLKKAINNICSDLMLVNVVVLQDKPQSTEKLETIGQDSCAQCRVCEAH